jgi:energy-converting hydrogenase A subunit M
MTPEELAEKHATQVRIGKFRWTKEDVVEAIKEALSQKREPIAQILIDTYDCPAAFEMEVALETADKILSLASPATD